MGTAGGFDEEYYGQMMVIDGALAMSSVILFSSIIEFLVTDSSVGCHMALLAEVNSGKDGSSALSTEVQASCRLPIKSVCYAVTSPRFLKIARREKFNGVRSVGGGQNGTHKYNPVAELCHIQPITYRNAEMHRSPIMNHHASSFIHRHLPNFSPLRGLTFFRRVAGVSPLLSIGWWYLSLVTPKILRSGCVRKDKEGSSVSGSVCFFTSLDVPSSALRLRTSLQAVALKSKIETLLNKDSGSLLESSSERDVVKLKLPKFELKMFSGDPKEYLTFWNIFRKIHDLEELIAIDKFQYLYQYKELYSKAARLISSFPITAENYPKAVEQLKLRFGREDLSANICP
ncbi:integrase catalytic domain-containing protein [Trichonephila clavipes]|nr:integrase catalytic domain-containing protein [Trichonephila clavipes]